MTLIKNPYQIVIQGGEYLFVALLIDILFESGTNKLLLFMVSESCSNRAFFKVRTLI